MPVKFFSFGPDDHYAYPEISDFSETSKDLNIPDSDECLDGFVGASYSAIDLELDESDRPQEDDMSSDVDASPLHPVVSRRWRLSPAYISVLLRLKIILEVEMKRIITMSI